MENKIKNLVFDLGEVIVLNNINFSKFDKEFSLSQGTLRKIIKNYSNRLLFKNKSDFKKFRRNKNFPLTFTQYEKICHAIFKSEKINRVLVNWIKNKKGDYKIFLLTNSTSEILINLLKNKFKIIKTFDQIFSSAETKLSKSNPKFFEYFLKEIKANPQECLFVDDKINNIRVAKKIGFETILFNNNKDFFKKISRLKL